MKSKTILIKTIPSPPVRGLLLVCGLAASEKRKILIQIS